MITKKSVCIGLTYEQIAWYKANDICLSRMVQRVLNEKMEVET